MFELKEAMEYYRRQGAPGDQNALVQLLTEIQQAYHAIPTSLLPEISAFYRIRESYLSAIIRRYPRLRLENTHVLEICAGPNCPRRADLLRLVEDTWGSKPAGFTIKTVPCMRMCGKGPNIRFDGQIFHRADLALLKKLLGD